MNTFKHLTVFSPTHLPHHLIIILLPEKHTTNKNKIKHNWKSKIQTYIIQYMNWKWTRIKKKRKKIINL
jgi:hypothetical protein